ncbi:hypothetical protein B296_00023898 [Ensete ventricosum]|uniref:Uncharacterized protein n=1 Tax=Ensete ventricosum TaxID=4639 RepID=A0A426X6Z7_ENSVE|nr:hypothetical protein B296_00023898 [Ensete ventricosum]
MSRAYSSFYQFLLHRLKNSKYWPFPTYWPLGSCTSTVSRKNTTIINFARSHALSRVLIDFSCTVSKIQNTSYSRRISPWEWASVGEWASIPLRA